MKNVGTLLKGFKEFHRCEGRLVWPQPIGCHTSDIRYVGRRSVLSQEACSGCNRRDRALRWRDHRQSRRSIFWFSQSRRRRDRSDWWSGQKGSQNRQRQAEALTGLAVNRLHGCRLTVDAQAGALDENGIWEFSSPCLREALL